MAGIMTELRILTFKERCRTFAQCLKIAPDAFVLDDDRKVHAVSSSMPGSDVLLKAAKACPYRAIALVDDATGDQVFPVRHR